MYTVVWTTFDGPCFSVMNENELSEFLNEEGLRIAWVGTAHRFDWNSANMGFIISGDAVIPNIRTYTKLSIS